MFLNISSIFYRIPKLLFFMIILAIYLLISLWTLLARMVCAACLSIFFSDNYNQNSFASQKLQLFSKAMKPKASFAHYITMVPLTDSMPEFFHEVPLPT